MAISPEVVQRAKARVDTVLNGKWRLERMLGIGGMAAVYAAVHRNQNRVAIKMLHTELSVDDAVKTRFLREGYAANTVGHIGAVAVYDDDIGEDGAAFLVMELLQGETLEDRATRKGGRLEPGEVLQLTDQLLDVLAAAHERGILHRDIKPDNLFLTTTGQLKVLDFGIARLRELAGAATNMNTGVGTFMGTPAFMSPEQARGRWDDIDARSDIWSIGATMFALLSGQNVHDADTITDQLVLAATAPARSLGTVLPELPQPVIDLVDRALAYDKVQRWVSAHTMQLAVRDAVPLVAPARDLTAPRVSLSVLERDRESDTVAAPAGMLGNGRPVSLASAVTSSSPRTTSSRRRSRFGLVMAGLTLVFLGFAAFAALRAPESGREAPSGAEPQLPKPASEPPALQQEPARRVPEEPVVTQAVPILGHDAGDDTPRARSKGSRRPAARVQKPAGAGARAAGSSTETKTNAPAPTHDPFEKRY
ncbi:MAG TPA: serine/threonine-protein kinase [Polyangiaceae bacterium]|nr:serine/threonine-protein kinase [Polyangiaceae bacterium]